MTRLAAFIRRLLHEIHYNNRHAASGPRLSNAAVRRGKKGKR